MARIIRLEGYDMSNGVAADRLISLVERVERLEEEKRALASDIADLYKEAKSAGFDPKVMRAMVKERRMSEIDRQEWQALCEVYRAALGMLDGTPLGEAARRRFMPDVPASASDPDRLGGQFGGAPTPEAAADEAAGQPSAEDILSARAVGAAAAKAGRRVTENPHPAESALRAAWDEGWCGASGSDGMDIPAAFRRRTPPRPPGAGADQGAQA